MKKSYLFIIYFILAAIFLIFYFSLDNKKIYNTENIIGKKIEIVELTLFTNNIFNTKEISNFEYTLINFWASWCGPCRKEHKNLVRLSKLTNLKIIGINFKDDENNAKSGSGPESDSESPPQFTGSMPNMPNMPDLEGMKSHLHSLFNGKIGSLAKEMAEEISGDFVDFLGGSDTKDLNQSDIMKKLMKNPKKIMDLMKKVTGKLDEKLKSGNISRDEIMKEATDIMGKMKEMGGGDEFNDLMKNLTKGMGKGMKFNKGAFNAMQKDMEKREQLKERIRKKSTLQKKNANESVFKIVDEEQQRTARLKADEAMELLLAEEEKEKAEKEKAPPSKSKSKKKKKKKA